MPFLGGYQFVVGIEKWRTKPGTTGKNAVDWEAHFDDPADPWPLVNPYGQVPVFHFRTDEPYGHPEHEGFYGPQDLIHKLAVSHAAASGSFRCWLFSRMYVFSVL